MESLKNYYENYKKQILLGGALLFIIIITFFSFVQIEKRYKRENKEIVATLIEKNTDDKKEAEDLVETVIKENIKVDVKGFVVNEGVYSLESGSRVIDAITAAGGLSEGANTRYLNLSKIICDEDVIIINSLDEIEKMKLEVQEQAIKEEIPCETVNKSCLTEEKIVTSTLVEETKDADNTNTTQDTNNASKGDNTEELNTLVNINTASKETLLTLDGIGESKADKIIEYRNTLGNFKTIDEIKNVSGIGNSVYDKIKDHINLSDLNYLYNLYQNHLAKHPRKQKLKSQNQ